MEFMNNINIIADLTEIKKDEWLELRRGKITGSDIYTLMGDRNYKSLTNLYNKKLYGEERELNNNSIDFGIRLEKPLVNLFGSIYNVEVLEFKKMVTSINNNRLAANIDSLFVEDNKYKILEVKTGSETSISKWDNKVPNQYLYQLLFYMIVYNIEYGTLFGMIGGKQEEGNIRQVIRFDVVKNDYLDLIDKIKMRVERFILWMDSEMPSEEEYKRIIKEENGKN